MCMLSCVVLYCVLFHVCYLLCGIDCVGYVCVLFLYMCVTCVTCLLHLCAVYVVPLNVSPCFHVLYVICFALGILCLYLCVSALGMCELLDFYYVYVLCMCACHDI